ncbi:ATP synthase delta/epsilon chain alpha-helix domain-containing protein [Clostridium sp.]|uniref:ATP synthase delta/epsilon chain alpha-helix domain-containing protein n=1 Tax=Clostridium sp. TaxID=1506 RepID=UPI002FC7B460
MANTFKLKIMTADSVKIDEDAISIITQTEDGKIEILANHAAIVINTVPCVSEVVKANGEKVKFFTSKGIIGFKENKLNFCCNSSELQDEIDIERAAAAKERAEKRLKDENYDSKRAEAALARALTRLQLKNK